MQSQNPQRVSIGMGAADAGKNATSYSSIAISGETTGVSAISEGIAWTSELTEAFMEVRCPADRLQPLVEFVNIYLRGHGYLALCVCVAGALLNSAVIAVLTKKQMRNPVNLLLMLLACAELSVLVLYLPYDIIVYLTADQSLPLYVTASYAEAVYILFYINASVLLHMIGTWMIIMTACFRYVCVQFPVQSATLCSLRRAALAAALTVAACTLLSVPNVFRNAVIAVPTEMIKDWHVFDTLPNGSVIAPLLYTINSSAPFFHNEHLSRMNYWLYGLLGKIVPSVLLLVLTALLISLLRMARRRRLRLYTNGCSSALADGSSLHARRASHEAGRDDGSRRRDDGRNRREDGGVREHVRTTRMLLAVVVLFLTVDLPHGVLVIASSIDACHLEAYNFLGDIIDLATLIAFSVNFALYCSMSKRFRELFVTQLLACVNPIKNLLRLLCLKVTLRRKASPLKASIKGRRHALAAVRGKGGGETNCHPRSTSATNWSGKSSMESFHLGIDQQHTSISQLLCSSSSSEESLVDKH